MRILADMGVDMRVVRWLRSQGHDAAHLREGGLQRLPDGEIFTKAIAESRVIVTFDLDFGEILALAKGRKAGVILFRLRNTSAPGSPMTIDLFIDWPALSTHQSENATFTFLQLRKCENMKNKSDSVGEID